MSSFWQPVILQIVGLIFNPVYESVIKLANSLKIKSGVTHVVDLGMGVGAFSEYFQGLNYMGVDIEEKNVLRAKERFPNGTFYCASMVDIGTLMEESSTDLIFISGAFHHMPDEDVHATLKQLRRIVRDTGKLFVLEIEPPVHWFNYFGKFIRWLDQGKYIRSFQRNKELLESNGWAIKESGVMSKMLLDVSYYLAS